MVLVLEVEALIVMEVEMMTVQEGEVEEVAHCYFMLLEVFTLMVSLTQPVVLEEIVRMVQNVEKEAEVLVEE